MKVKVRLRKLLKKWMELNFKVKDQQQRLQGKKVDPKLKTNVFNAGNMDTGKMNAEKSPAIEAEVDMVETVESNYL